MPRLAFGMMLGVLGAGLLGAASVAVSPAAPAPAPETARSAAELYRQALPPYAFRFPEDHAAHPEFRTEWWYYTGHLAAGTRRFGYQFTFFQIGIDPRRRESRSEWSPHTLYFAHLALTDKNRGSYFFDEQISRPALEMAGARTDTYRVWLHDWSVERTPEGEHQLRAETDEFSLDLRLTLRKPPVVHGFGGVSRKGPRLGQASHYYSLTRLDTHGELRLQGTRFRVTGQSWMDHEFGSNQLTADQEGWDWFSLQLDNGRELMVYLLRLRDGGLVAASSGTIVDPDGAWRHLPLSALDVRSTRTWRSSSGAVYPAAWRVSVPAEGLSLEIEPDVADQEMRSELMGVTYWEGSVSVRGTDRSTAVTGLGYVELTGYTGPVPEI
jgi:predicted secreted hydrolase